MLRDEDIIEALPRISVEWLAGFFDGEGSVSVQISYSAYATVSVTLTQKDAKILALVMLKYNAGNVKSYKGANGATCHRWRVRGKSAEQFLTEIAPYTIVKRRQIEKALELLKFVGKTDLNSLGNRISLGRDITALNREGNVSG
jgi:hypothetical protein